MTSVLLSNDALAALIAKNDARKRRHEHCEQDDYGCITLDVSHYADDICAQDIDALLGHIGALEAATPALVTTEKRVNVRAERAGVIVEQMDANRWTIGIPAGGRLVAIWLESRAPIDYRVRTLSTDFEPALRLIPRVPIASLRFGQLLVNAVQRATGAHNEEILQHLFYVRNDDLQRQVNDYFKELM